MRVRGIVGWKKRAQGTNENQQRIFFRKGHFYEPGTDAPLIKV